MNEHLFTTNDGLRLITQFEGAPRLKARLCEGGAWELSFGVTFRPDGARIKEGETCSEDEALTLFRHALGVFERAVRDLVTIELKPHEFSALVALCYNIGIENMRTSTVLREVNAGRMYDAAAAFGMWVFATRGGYKQALRGLLRRRYAEASLLLGYDWVVATEEDAIALQREKPATLPGRDKVLYKTPFKDVLAVAQHYPLVDSQIATHAQVAAPLPYQPAPIEAPSAVNLDSPTPAPIGREIPVQLPLPEIEQDELLLEQAAASVASPDTNEAASEPPPSSPAPGRVSPVSKSDQQPSNSVGPISKPTTETEAAAPLSRSAGPVSGPAPSPLGPAAGVKPAPAEPPLAPLPPLAPPKLPPVIAQKQIDSRGVPYGEIPPDGKPKNMTDSARVIGLVIVGIGSIVQVLSAREIISTTIGAVFYDLSRDSAFVAMAAGGVAMLIGWATRKRGTAVVVKGMVNATALLK